LEHLEAFTSSSSNVGRRCGGWLIIRAAGGAALFASGFFAASLRLGEGLRIASSRVAASCSAC
jgi:hypothetical protein